MNQHKKLSLSALAWLALTACSSATSGTGQPSGPTPAPPGDNNPSVPAPSGSTLSYQPVRNATYALERHDSLTLQLPGGASQQQLIDRTAFLTVSLTPDTGHYQATIVLDSLRATSSGVPVVPDSLTPARGTRWTGTLSPYGQLSALKADRSTTFGDQVGSNLRSLFPALPGGGAKVGMEWTDTTEVPLRADAFDATERSLTNYRASESDDPKARKAIKLESSGSYDRKGKGTQYEQQLEMTASGRRVAVYYLTMDGTLLSARGSDSGDMTITIPAVGQTVPVKQSGTYSITAIRPPKK